MQWLCLPNISSSVARIARNLLLHAYVCDPPQHMEWHGISVLFRAAVSAMRALWAKVLQHLLGWLWSPQTKRSLERKPTEPMKSVPSVKNSTVPCEGSKLDLGTNPEAGSQETRVRGSIPGIPENWRELMELDGTDGTECFWYLGSSTCSLRPGRAE